MKRENVNLVVGLIAILVLFIVASIYVQNNLEDVKEFIDGGPVSILIYISLLIIATVVAPISVIPLMPVASGVWGWPLTAVFSITGWGIGAVIAFTLARVYGVPLVRKFVPLDKAAKFERLIPKENIFWGIVLLRIAIPVDLLSYALGLFSKVRYRDYALATIIGISPLAFILAYLGTLPFIFQMIALSVALVLILSGFIIASSLGKRSAVGEPKS